MKNKIEFLEKLYDLDFGESYTFKACHYTRVPGGWVCILSDWQSDQQRETFNSCCFIPFSDEFLGAKNDQE